MTRSDGRAGDLTAPFQQLVDEITSIGLDWHRQQILDNSKFNARFVDKTIRDLPKVGGAKAESAVIISAGPSLHKHEILTRLKACNYRGTIVAIDGSFVRCLKSGISPDYVLTLDPHETRMVRWFGDPEFEQNMAGDDYFSRQDLDIEFRNNTLDENQRNIALVNEQGRGRKLIICSTAPPNLVKRVREVGFDCYWWAPLVDDPASPESLTRAIVEATGLPALNTGGTVGTAAWLFAQAVLGVPRIAVVGMDLGYFKADTSYFQTQTFYRLQERVADPAELEHFFPEFTYPGTEEVFYTDPTYYWYRCNMLDLIQASGATVYNCTGGGTLIGDGVQCMQIEEFCAAN